MVAPEGDSELQGRERIHHLAEAKVTASEHILFQRLPQGESVILNLRDERYYGLDAVATRMWDALIEAATLDEAHAKLMEVYDVSDSTLWTDLTQMVEDLRSAGAVEVENVENV